MDKEKPSPYSIQPLDLADEKVQEDLEVIEDAVLEVQDVAVLWVNSPLFTLGAMEGQTVVGVVQVDKDGHINYMVHPRYQKQGIASQLVDQSLVYAKNTGLKGLVATVIPGSPSEKLLQNKQFTLVGSEGNRSTYARKVS